MEETWKLWGRTLRRLRSEADLSQRGLADRLGVDQKTVSSWELGRNPPADDKKIRLAQEFGLSLTDLFPWPEAVAS